MSVTYLEQLQDYYEVFEDRKIASTFKQDKGVISLVKGHTIPVKCISFVSSRAIVEKESKKRMGRAEKTFKRLVGLNVKPLDFQFLQDNGE